MRFSNLTPILLLAALNAADAFSMTMQASPLGRARNVLKTIRRIREFSDPLMFKDRKGNYLQLPSSVSRRERLGAILDIQYSSVLDQEVPILTNGKENDVIGFLVNGLQIPDIDFSAPVGTLKPKTASEPRNEKWLEVFTNTINDIIKPTRMPCEGYLYFGNQDYTKILPMLCQCNPFFASALTVSGDNDEYFELNILGDHKYAQVMKTMRETVRTNNFSVRFNKDMTLNQIVNYETGQPVVVPESEWNDYASGVCYSMYYYVQSIHALIHVLHYFAILGMNFSTDHDEALHAWAELYDDNIVLKYIEVGALLYDSSFQLDSRGGNPGKKITGGGTEDKITLGGSRAVMDGPMLDILCDWGSCKNTDDFTKKFLLQDIYETAKNPEEAIKAGDILTEFKKHLANVDPFATELSDAMKADDADAVATTEKEMKEFMSEIGDGVFSIDTISSFVSLMSCTGMMHGSTLGFTRMTIMPEVMRWIDETSDKWTVRDCGFIDETMGTMAGMAEGRHVFTQETEEGKEWDTTNLSDRVKAVLDKYDAKAEALKKAYQKEIEKRDDFREFGWILTDHCPDGYDGKQHTITTYI